MLIKINQDTYVESTAIDAIQNVKETICYYKDEPATLLEHVIIYTRGGEAFNYDGTIEQCIEQVKETEK